MAKAIVLILMFLALPIRSFAGPTGYDCELVNRSGKNVAARSWLGGFFLSVSRKAIEVPESHLTEASVEQISKALETSDGAPADRLKKALNEDHFEGFPFRGIAAPFVRSNLHPDFARYAVDTKSNLAFEVLNDFESLVDIHVLVSKGVMEGAASGTVLIQYRLDQNFETDRYRCEAQ